MQGGRRGVEFLRDTESAPCDAVDGLLEAEIPVCDPIRMEVLAGARDESHLRQFRGLLAQATVLPTGSADYEAAAAPYRTCRRRGETARELVNCLIAAVAVRDAVRSSTPTPTSRCSPGTPRSSHTVPAHENPAGSNRPPRRRRTPRSAQQRNGGDHRSSRGDDGASQPDGLTVEALGHVHS